MLYFYTGQTDKAIQTISQVLKADKAHLKANYNLGVFLWQSPRKDYSGAAAQFEKVITLTQGNPREAEILQQAQTAPAAVAKDAAAAGRPITTP